ncbi:hypothetical protein SPRG_20470, partial [Saprolegnia parasitica CBS 223.65]
HQLPRGPILNSIPARRSRAQERRLLGCLQPLTSTFRRVVPPTATPRQVSLPCAARARAPEPPTPCRATQDARSLPPRPLAPRSLHRSPQQSLPAPPRPKSASATCAHLTASAAELLALVCATEIVRLSVVAAPLPTLCNVHPSKEGHIAARRCQDVT